MFAARFWQSTQTILFRKVFYSTIVRTPPRSAPREVPTPLVFVSTGKWDPVSSNGMTYFSSMLAEKGFTCLQTDLTLPDDPVSDSTALIRHFESKLRNEIILSTIPFPPIIFARESACLVSQAYISSFPASGLFLISPPASNSLVPKHKLPTNLVEFDFEPKFPIGIMATPKELDFLRIHHRLGDDPRVDTMVVDDTKGSHALAEIEKWLDELGI